MASSNIEINFSEDSKREFAELSKSLDALGRKFEPKKEHIIVRVCDSYSRFGLNMLGIICATALVHKGFIAFKEFVVHAWVGFHK